MTMARAVLSALLCASLYGGDSSASSLPLRDTGTSLDVRALPNSPSGGYAPKVVTCPSTKPTLRSARSGLGPDETAFLNKRRANTVQPMADFMSRANISGFDAASYVNTHSTNISALPNIAIAVSGGGYRALMNGAGFVAAADNRTSGSTDEGGIGGLLQASTYLAGLSGGGWLVGSIYSNNFSTVTNLRDGSSGSSVWKFDSSIFSGPKESGISILNTAQYWDDIYDQVQDKVNVGFDSSITDYWGRALSYQLINASDGGLAYTFSSIGLDQNLLAGNIPMPLLVADERSPGSTIISLNATNYEIGPWEFGTFDPAVYGFAPTKYLASNFSGGSIPEGGNCVEGFDQAGYMMGTSSSLFNQFLTTNLSTYANIPQVLVKLIDTILSEVGEDNNDIAQWIPNPFLGWNNATNPSAASIQLSMVDGGEDLQNIPLNPLIQPIRGVDVIFAVDSSADTTYNWPNGTALRATYERSLNSTISNGTLFPAVPDDHTFINLGLNNNPTFFGCDASNFTTTAGQAIPPLVVYLPNAPYTTSSNVSTFTDSYPLAQRNDIITNGFNAASQGNATLDPEWPACMACAALSRSFGRTGTAVPQACAACFSRYCWNGTVDSTDRGGEYEPAFKISDQTTASSSAAAAGLMRSSSSPLGGLWMVVVGSGLLLWLG